MNKPENIFRKIQWQIKKSYQRKTNFIEVPGDHKWNKVTEQDSLRMLNEEASRYFFQVYQTKFVQKDRKLRDVFSKSSPTQLRKKCMNGTSLILERFRSLYRTKRIT